MNPEFVILDSSIKYMNAKNVLEEGLFYCPENTWSRDFNKAVKYADSNSAIDVAKNLRNEEGLPKRVLVTQKNGNNINVGDVFFE
jgi:hypothetical protein